MQHSVKQIGDNYQEFSVMRKDKNQFSSSDFFQFAKNNIKKYSLIENGEDLLVSTFFSDELISDYKLTIQNI